MKILITAPSLDTIKNVSGVSTVVNTIIDHNLEHNFYHYLLGRSDKPMNKIVWLMLLIKQILLFPIVLKKEGIQLVHQNLPFDPKGVSREFIVNTWCRLFRVPVVLHVHGGKFLMDKTTNPIFLAFAKSMFKYSRAVVVLSDLEKETLKNLYNFNNASVLYNSIDTNYYLPKQKQQKTGQLPTLLFLGRIHESKGVEDIANALKKLKNDIDFKFILCGTGPMEDAFKAECQNILGDRFEFKGIVSGKQKLEAIGQSDIFLLPSRYGEGLPMALLETMSAGLVPVVTDDASMKYIIQHKTNGLHVEKQNPEDIYNKLKEIITDKKLYQTISKNTREHVVKNFDVKAYIQKLNTIYSKVDTN